MGNKNEFLSDKKKYEKTNVPSIEKIHILLAEDQVFNQMVVRSMSEDWGFEIDIVENGVEVLEKMKTTRYDVVLMDISMPLMDGVEAARRIRNDLSKPANETPIIAITANAYSEDHRKYTEAGMNDTISKPFRSQVLFQKIAGSLGITKANFSHPPEQFYDDDILFVSPDENLFDLSILKGISKGKRQTIDKLLNMFIEKATEEMAQIKTVAAQNNWQQLASITHKMKPALAYLRMKLLETKINEIQHIAIEMKETDKIPHLVEVAGQLLNKIILLLKKEMDDETSTTK